jgi:hypothetical protein
MLRFASMCLQVRHTYIETTIFSSQVLKRSRLVSLNIFIIFITIDNRLFTKLQAKIFRRLSTYQGLRNCVRSPTPSESSSTTASSAPSTHGCTTTRVGTSASSTSSTSSASTTSSTTSITPEIVYQFPSYRLIVVAYRAEFGWVNLSIGNNLSQPM